MRILLAALVAFVVSAALGRALIPALRRLKAGQSIKEDGPTWHMAKQGTPTMGGLMFICGVTVSVLCVGFSDLRSGLWSAVYVLGFSLVFGCIGFLDDYAKVKKKENTGLTAPQKFLLQLSAAILFTVLLRYTGHLTPNLYVPFLDVTLPLRWPAYMVFAAFVMVGTVNAVNITDGVDGLAAGVTLPVAAFFTAISAWGAAYWHKAEYMPLALFSAALFGALVGFLLYNSHPAKVFMGDTGSLFLGGAVCGLAFALDLPLILIPVGVIYIAETLSDIIQVVYFKATRGKRIFRMAPLHHHLELGGWGENKLCLVFGSVTLAGCLLAFWGVMGRFPLS
ncbi:MAG: phospho-N-acetylmuramoyl-pentapeptide-transferase [Clostridiales bacterium]|nr:phospho-N-acetylmuramoyl-pentapeptide-transferase [Clostridiales bacterium]